MERQKTRLEVDEYRKVLTSRNINIMKGYLQEDDYSPIEFCLTEVALSMLIEEAYGYTMG